MKYNLSKKIKIGIKNIWERGFGGRIIGEMGNQWEMVFCTKFVREFGIRDFGLGEMGGNRKYEGMFISKLRVSTEICLKLND